MQRIENSEDFGQVRANVLSLKTKQNRNLSKRFTNDTNGDYR